MPSSLDSLDVTTVHFIGPDRFNLWAEVQGQDFIYMTLDAS